MNFYSASSSDESSSIAFVEFVQFTPLQPEQAAEHSIPFVRQLHFKVLHLVLHPHFKYWRTFEGAAGISVGIGLKIPSSLFFAFCFLHIAIQFRLVKSTHYFNGWRTKANLHFTAANCCKRYVFFKMLEKALFYEWFRVRLYCFVSHQGTQIFYWKIVIIFFLKLRHCRHKGFASCIQVRSFIIFSFPTVCWGCSFRMKLDGIPRLVR